MAWLFGGGKGRGDLVEVLGNFLRVVGSRCDERTRLLQQLKQLSQRQENHELLGRAIGSLLGVLKQYQQSHQQAKDKDLEAVQLSLEILTEIMKLPDEDKLGLNYVEMMNTDLFLNNGQEPAQASQHQAGNSAALSLVLHQFADTDSRVRFDALHLLEIVSGNGQLASIQETCLSTPMAVSNIVDLLRDSHEVIRHEAILLLVDLCTNNVEIQKAVGLLGAMETLLNIVYQEGGVEGGAVVLDCLQLLLLLFRNNVVNQNNFRESSLMGRLPPLLDLDGNTALSTGGGVPKHDAAAVSSGSAAQSSHPTSTNGSSSSSAAAAAGGAAAAAAAAGGPTHTTARLLTASASDSAVQVVTLTLQLLGALLAPNHPHLYTHQSLLGARDQALPRVARLALSKHCPSPLLRAHALEALAALCAHHVDNQNFLAALEVDVPVGQGVLERHSALLRLVWIALNAGFVYERVAAVAALAAFTAEHAEGQCALASTLTPPPVPDDRSIGQHLLANLFGWESTQQSGADLTLSQNCFFASLLLQAVLRDCPSAKELCLRLPLALPSRPSGSTTLLVRCVESLLNAFRTGASVAVKVALLRLLCVWLAEHPASVAAFLAQPQGLQLLVEQVNAGLAASQQQQQQQQGGVDSPPWLSALCAVLLAVAFVTGGSSAESDSSFQLIAQRIGLDRLSERIDALRRTELFAYAEEPANAWTTARLCRDEEAVLYLRVMYFDCEFTRFVKELHDRLQKLIRRGAQANRPRQRELRSAVSSVSAANAAVAAASPARSSTGVGSDELTALRERVLALETELAAEKRISAAELPPLRQTVAERTAQLDAAQKQIEKLQQQQQQQRQYHQQLPTSASAVLGTSTEAIELQTLTKAYVELESILQSRETELVKLRAQLQQQQQQLHAVASSTDGRVEQENSRLQAQVATLQRELKQLQLQLQAQQQQQPPAAQQQQPPSDTARKLKDLEEKFASLEAEQEELLMVLAKTEIENNTLKERLRASGAVIPSQK